MSTLDRPNRQGYEISIHARPDGSFQAAYIQLHESESGRTQTIQPNTILLDRDHADRVIGIEILTPIPRAALEALTVHLDLSDQVLFQQFIEKYAPPSLFISQ